MRSIPIHCAALAFLASVALAGLCCAERADVLLYYANETAPDATQLANQRQFEEWMKQTGDESAIELAEGIARDREMFPAAVDDEIDAITQALKDHQAPLPVIIATNRLAREGKVLFFDPSKGWKEHPIPFTRSEDYILASNRLADLPNLGIYLAAAADLCPPDKHRYVLVTKSHGCAERALTVRLSRHHEDTSFEEIRAMIDDPSSVAPEDIKQLGITQTEVLETLSKAGRESQMAFPLVFVESCKGVFESSIAEDLPDNVQHLVASGERNLGYQTLDYPHLISTIGEDTTFSESLGSFLEPRYDSAIRQTATASLGWPLTLFALGAAIFLSGVVRRKNGSPLVSDAPHT